MSRSRKKAPPQANPPASEPSPAAESDEASTTVEPETAAPPGIAGRVRAVVFILVAIFMLLSPIPKQLMGVSTGFQGWTMYGNRGTGIMDLRYVIKHEDGSETPVDRYELLGYASREDAPRNSVWRIRSLSKLERLNQRLVKALPPETDLRVYIRVATEDGWVKTAEGAIPVGNYLAVPWDPVEAMAMVDHDDGDDSDGDGEEDSE